MRNPLATPCLPAVCPPRGAVTDSSRRAPVAPGTWLTGNLRDASTCRRFPVVNPSTGEVFAVAPHADAAMCDDAVEAAEAAFPEWAATPIEERRALMTKALDILQAHEAELAELLVKEQGKPLAMAIGECGMCWEHMQKTIDTELPVEVYSEDEDFKTIAVRKPIGPVACITPWNVSAYGAARACRSSAAASPRSWLSQQLHPDWPRALCPRGVAAVPDVHRGAEVGALHHLGKHHRAQALAVHPAHRPARRGAPR